MSKTPLRQLSGGCFTPDAVRGPLPWGWEWDAPCEPWPGQFHGAAQAQIADVQAEVVAVPSAPPPGRIQ